MASQSHGSDSWSFTYPIGELRGAALTGRVDVSRPQQGLHTLRAASTAIGGSLLQLGWETDPAAHAVAGAAPAWPAKVSEAYVRGPDLVATYEQAADWLFAPQIYWRVGAIDTAAGVLASMTLLVSLQTDLLDSRPRIDVSSDLAVEEAALVTPANDGPSDVRWFTAGQQHTLGQRSGPGCVVCRLPGGGLSYAEISPANDFRRLVVGRDETGSCHTRWELFSDFLEKGVIRRARIELVLLPRENDVQLAAKICRALAARPLPLTT
jgi:hypothetical protein